MSVCHAHLLSRSGLRCMSQTSFYYIYLSFIIIIIIIIIITFSDVKPVAQISVRSSCLENVQTLYVDGRYVAETAEDRCTEKRN